MVSHLVHRLFEDDPAALVGHLVGESEFEPEELDALESLIRSKRKSARASGTVKSTPRSRTRSPNDNSDVE
jgi:hypothetical protein